MRLRYLLVLLLIAAPVLPVLAQEATAEAQTTPSAPTEPRYTALALLDRGAAAYNARNYAQAVSDFSLLILFNPTYWRGYYSRGRAYDRLGDSERAAQDLTAALQFAEGSTEVQAIVYADRGDVYAAMGESALALSDYDAAIALLPNTDRYTRRALLNLANAAYADAVSDLDAAIALTSDSPPLFYQRGLARTGTGDTAGAAADFYAWALGVQPTPQEQPTLTAGETVTLAMSARTVYRLPFKANAGETISIVAANLDGDVDPLIVLTDMNDTPLVANDSAAPGERNAAIQAYMVEQEGVYNLYVTHAATGYDGRVIVMLEIR